MARIAIAIRFRRLQKLWYCGRNRGCRPQIKTFCRYTSVSPIIGLLVAWLALTCLGFCFISVYYLILNWVSSKVTFMLWWQGNRRISVTWPPLPVNIWWCFHNLWMHTSHWCFGGIACSPWCKHLASKARLPNLWALFSI